jgi:ABC-type transport system involved in multi-copper enzyme maturation permease subunit
MSPAIDSLCQTLTLAQLRIQLSDELVNWLTPVWILGMGALAGLILCGVIWLIAAALSRIPVVGELAENRRAKWTAIGVIGAVVFAVGVVSGWFTPPERLPDAPRPAVEVEAPAAQPRETGLSRALSAATGLAAGAVLSLVAGLAAVIMVSRRTIEESWIALREGVLFPLFITACVLASFGIFGLTVVRKPGELLDSLARWPVLTFNGTVSETFDVPAPPNAFDEPPETTVPVNFRRDEVARMTFSSDQRVRISTEPFAARSAAAALIDVPAGGTGTWQKLPSSANPFKTAVVRELYVKNFGDKAAQVKFTANMQIAHPEMLTVPMMAIAMAGVFLLYLVQRTATPKLAAIALATSKSEMATPLFAILMAGGIFLLLIFIWIPYNTFGDDIKMLKDSGLSLILFLGIIQAVWGACQSVAEEIDGKTALTVLSKPVSRRDFILGKFVGIAWAVGLMTAIFGIVLLIGVAYKPVYDAREGADIDPNWQYCFREMILIVPGLVLAYFEILVLAAISVAISTRLPTLANFIISFAIYVLGNLTPLLVQSQVVADQLEPVIFFGRLVATILPVLDHFNIQASVAAGVPVPMLYLGWAMLYCLLYSAVAMLLALTLFEDRDLA